MLNKLSILSDSDNFISKLLESWVRGNKADVSKIIDWYNEKGLRKKDISVYRGIRFKEGRFNKLISDLFAGGSINLGKKKGFSWSGSPDKALDFSLGVGGGGFILSRKLTPNSSYVDVVESFRYLSSVGNVSDKAIESLAEKDCEFITTDLVCSKCRFEDIDLIPVFNSNVSNLITLAKAYKYEVEDKRKRVSYFSLVSVVDNSVVLLDKNTWFKYLKNFPNVKC